MREAAEILHVKPCTVCRLVRDYAFHASPARFEADRQRSNQLTAGGFRLRRCCRPSLEAALGAVAGADAL